LQIELALAKSQWLISHWLFGFHRSNKLYSFINEKFISLATPARLSRVDVKSSVTIQSQEPKAKS
jgi:hypothetical protein